MLCSKSQWVAGRWQPGPVQVACRTWARCRSLTPGSWPLAWCRWSQSPGGVGLEVGERAAGAGDAGGDPPAAVSAGRAGLAGRGEGEPGPAGRIRAGWFIWFAWFRAVPGAVGGCGAGAAVADGVALAVGDGDAPGG